MSEPPFSPKHSFPGQSLVHRFVPESLRPKGYFARLTRARSGGRVISGPFKGMRYVEKAVGSAYVPKILGIYERELAPQTEEICQLRPDRIVDIGAAEGYYAVGLAIRNPQARVTAFEMEQSGRTLLGEMARLNGVENHLDIAGKCEPQDLASALAGAITPVVVCDVEGYEDVLLDPAAVPALHEAYILAEMHDSMCEGVTERLQARFSSTHEVERIWQQRRSRSEYPWRTLGTTLLPGAYLDAAVNEGRPIRMSWLWMKPRNGSSS